MVIDPKTLVEEMRAFRSQGLLASDRISSWLAARTSPFPIIAISIACAKVSLAPSEPPSAASGPPTKARPRALACASRIFCVPTVCAATSNATSPTSPQRWLNSERSQPDLDGLVKEYLAYGEEIRPFVRDASRFLYDEIRKGKNVLFEGAHGVLLDLDHGTYPFVTSSSTTAGGACTGCGIGPTSIDTVVGIVKAYTTRVGNGPFPTELFDKSGERLREVGREFGSTTGRPRRCGWLDLPALRLTIRLSGIKSLAITKLDVLDGLDEVKLCVAYRLNGQLLDEMPLDPDDLMAVEPVYETMPGWPARDPKAAPAGSMADLPAAARRYLARIAELVGVSPGLISWGPSRSETILISNPFLEASTN
jgi:adenylosuccinate synthase